MVGDENFASLSPLNHALSEKMYIRFQGQRQSDNSPSKLGIFQLAYELRDLGDFPEYAEKELLKNIDWLKMHLKSPKVLREDGHQRAIAWFHPRAMEPLKRIRAIKVILEEYGYHIEQVKINDPGVIIYEDGFQIIAKPYKKNT